MAKRGYINCERCGQPIKGKWLRNHKCTKKDPERLEKCQTCGLECSTKNIDRHRRSCQAKSLCKTFLPFFWFFLKVIRQFNRKQKHLNVLGDKTSKRAFINDMFEGEAHSTNLRDYRKLFEYLRKERELKAQEKIEEIMAELGIDTNEVKYLSTIKSAMIFDAPCMSARQVIFTFLNNKKVLTPLIKKRINRRLESHDTPTDEELKQSPYLFKQILKLRAHTGYDDSYEHFYFMLERYVADQDSFRCPYCKNFKMRIKKHTKRCKSFDKIFNDDKEGTIKDFLRRFYNSDKWTVDKELYFINYYIKYGPRYFIETIDKHIINRYLFLKKIEEGRSRYYKQKSLKWNFNEFKKSIDDWIPGEKKKENEEVDKPFESIDDNKKDFKLIRHLLDEDSDDDANEEMESEDCESKPLEELPEPDIKQLKATMKTFFNFKK